MTINNLKNNWNKSFKEAIDNIDLMLVASSNDADEKGFVNLANWLLSNNYNSYHYMPSKWEEFKENPYTTLRLLYMIHHALLDNGDISFVTLKIEGKIERVFMCFKCSFDEDFNDYCKKECSSTINSIVRGREIHNTIFKDQKQENVDKKYPLIENKDIVFTSHNDPYIFIKEFMEHRVVEENKQEEIERKLKKLRIG
jgi:hypothetical protein